MTDIYPFLGTRYNSRLIEDMKLVVSPFCSYLNPEKLKEISGRHTYNILHLIHPDSIEEDQEYNNSYQRVASTIQTWRRDGILVNDNHKSFYLYEQIYAKPVNGCKKRLGLFALMKVEDISPDPIPVEGSTPHINTSSLHKLLRTTNCHFSPATMFFHDHNMKFASFCNETVTKKPWENFQDQNGDTHNIWVINKKDLINQINGLFKDLDANLIEGHLLVEIARNYRDDQRETTGNADGNQPFDYMLVFLSSFEERSVITRPIHRVLSEELGSTVDDEEVLEDLSEYFTVRPIKTDVKKPETAAKKILETIAEKGKKHPAIGMALPDGRVFVMTLKSKIKISDIYDEETVLGKAAQKLHVSVLQHNIIRQIWIGNPEVELEEGDILYFDDAAAALSQISHREASAVFLLNPCLMKDISEVVAAGNMIPPFTATLHPPLINGLVFRDMSVRH